MVSKEKAYGIGKIAACLIAAVVVIGIMLMTVIASYSSVVNLSKDEPVFFLGFKPILVITGSMEPAIKVNSVSIAKSCSIKGIKIGDTVMYRSNNGILITHRVIRYTNTNGEKALITKGDANEAEDVYPVTNKMLKAKLTYTANYMAPLISQIMPEPGTVNTFALIRSLAIFALAIVAIVLIIKGAWSAIVSVYWVIVGDRQFENTMNRYNKDIQRNLRIHDKLTQTGSEIETRFKLIDKIELGIRRAQMQEHLKEIQKETKKLSKKSSKYLKRYNKFLCVGVENQKKFIDRLRKERETLEEQIKKNNEIYLDISTKVPISTDIDDLTIDNGEEYIEIKVIKAGNCENNKEISDDTLERC